MSKNENRFVAFGLLAGVAGIPMYLTAQAAPLHPKPEDAPSVMAATPSPEWAAAADRARQLVRASLAEQNLPGLSVAVGRDGDILWAEGFGWADLETRAPVTPDTEFRVGTASSVLTSAAVGLLLERDRLRLDEPIQTYVPQFPQKRWPVTLRQVMGHVAGIGTDGGNEGPLFSQRCERPVEALSHLAADDLLNEPGTQLRFSNYGWILASAAVEAGADQPFSVFMRDEIFRPLGMARTGAESATEENPDHIGEPSEDAPFLTLIHDLIMKPLGMARTKPRSTAQDRATYYAPRSGADPRRGHCVMRPHNLSCYAGSMAFLSTPSDLVRFGLGMQSGSLLKPSTVQLLQTSHRLPSGRKTNYGLGWALETVTIAGKPTLAVGHDGDSWGGGVASLRVLPDRGLVVVVMSNITHAGTAALALKVAEAFEVVRAASS